MARLIYASCFIFIFSFSGFCAEQMQHTDIAGTYRIVFFGSQVVKHEKEKDSALDGIADKFYISNNCKKAQELYPAIINHGLRNKCNTVTQSKILDGIVSISYDNANYLHIKSRLQMEGGVVDMSASDRYQYTVYAPIKYGNTLKGKGIVSWNYDSTNNRPSSNSVSFLESPFYITKLGKDILRIDITLVGKNVKVIDTKDKTLNEQIVINYLNKLKNPFMILSVKDVSKDLHIGINQAYDLFKQNDFPTICIGKRKGITLATYLLWKMNKKGGI